MAKYDLNAETVKIAKNELKQTIQMRSEDGKKTIQSFVLYGKKAVLANKPSEVVKLVEKEGDLTISIAPSQLSVKMRKAGLKIEVKGDEHAKKLSAYLNEEEGEENETPQREEEGNGTRRTRNRTTETEALPNDATMNGVNG